MKKQLLLTFGIVFIILLIDQVIKVYVKQNFYEGEELNLIGTWFQMTYTENPGMAFGTTFGGSIWAKLALSIFRLFAIAGITYYIVKQIKHGVRNEFLIAMALVLAGATGNLIDSACYDFFFAFDPCQDFNQMSGSGNFMTCDSYGIPMEVEVRNTGFLLGNVVDMFQFEASWPEWMPWLGGSRVFPAIWNIADGAISIGVFMILLRNRKYFPKQKESSKAAAE